MFVNGNLVYTEINSGYIADNDEPLTISKSIDWGPYPINGKMDNFRIYNRALSDNEIQALYSENSPFNLSLWAPTGKQPNDTVNPNNTISLFFNTPVNSATIKSNITLTKNGMQTVAFSPTLLSNGTQILISPAGGSFESGANYQLTLGAGITSKKGDALDATAISFTVQEPSPLERFMNLFPSSSDSQSTGERRLVWNGNT